MPSEQVDKMIKDSRWGQDYKKNHRFSEAFKKQLDKEHAPGTKIVDTISGEVYITK